MQELIVARPHKAKEGYSRLSMASAFCALVALSFTLGVEFYYLPTEAGRELVLHWSLIGVTLAGLALAVQRLVRGLMANQADC